MAEVKQLSTGMLFRTRWQGANKKIKEAVQAWIVRRDHKIYNIRELSKREKVMDFYEPLTWWVSGSLYKNCKPITLYETSNVGIWCKVL